MTDRTTSAGERWRTALAHWVIPQHVLEQAPESPHTIPPELFLPDRQACSPSAIRLAREGLADGGTLLDIGCGCGASSLPIADATTMITGVDASEAMLDEFRAQAMSRSVAHRAVHGRWPDVAPQVVRHSVVTAHHVIYNIAAIEEFLDELTRHARQRVVMEVTRTHPQSALNQLWRHFHGMDRPTEPAADDIVAVLRELGHDPIVVQDRRGEPAERVPRHDLVEFARRRLCLDASHDPEIDRLLPDDHAAPPRDVVCISWPTTAPVGDDGLPRRGVAEASMW
jgi:precorrin-6B methylase 2